MRIKLFNYEIIIEIRKIIKREFKPIESPAAKKMELDVQKIVYMKDAGMSNRQIAKRLNVSEGTIRNRLK